VNPTMANAQVQSAASGPASLLPKLPDWKATEAVRTYSPDSLFEYIDGAAEAYLGFDFRELAVGEYARAGSKATVTAEVYDMGSNLNAFGIYAAERYPESRFLPIGVQGYYEEGTLNFLSGRYYVKLLAFEAGDKAEEDLTLFARSMVSAVKDGGSFPARLAAFPAEGRIPNSERFLLHNVLGLKFLSNGYGAGYRSGGREFDAYLIDCASEADAETSLKALAGHFGGAGKTVAAVTGGFHAKDPYLKNVYAIQAGSALCLVTRVEDGQDAMAEKFLAEMVGALEKH
jgi:hypothetical protein